MIEQHPFVSVWIIVRNEAEHIGRTLTYLISQTYPKDSYEIIVVDGNSTDGTREVCNKMLKSSWIAYKVVNERDYKSKVGWPNRGHSFARNVALDLSDAKATYMAWTDGDCRVISQWLEILVAFMEKHKHNKKIAAAWWPRYVETQGNISKKELVLNYYFTSYIMSMGNAAFNDAWIDKTKEYQMSSIAGYNSIYRKEIQHRYRFDDFLPSCDDLEINYRIRKDGYQFLLCPWAIIYHREDPKLKRFFKRMRHYGYTIALAILKHRNPVRIYAPISLLYLLYTLLLPLSIYVSHQFFNTYYIPLLPYGVIMVLALAVFIENVRKAKTARSLLVFVLVPLHPLMYGIGIVNKFLGLGNR